MLIGNYGIGQIILMKDSLPPVGRRTTSTEYPLHASTLTSFRVV